MTGSGRGRRLIVDPIRCDAHGICAELLPELIQLDDWGYPIVNREVVPRGLEAHARHAVRACPTLALLLAEAEEPVQSRGRGR